ncbi:hypothetical protein OHT93_21695 [Streptomyces sp. NBC_00191]|uniref:hypothetical protein n=1 Tax=Streptomyces sp. NBC_00191 TaxID=2975674 RepID=UPI003253A925
MTDWSQLSDAYGSAERIPLLLDRVGIEEGVWDELWGRLCHQGVTAYSASFAALPSLAAVARSAEDRDSNEALLLAGSIMRCALQGHGADDILLSSSTAVEDLRDLADKRLAARPARYLELFAVLLALDGLPLWSEVMGGFSDDFYEVACPHCAAQITVAIGDYGYYSSIRDLHDGDVDRVPLRPIGVDELHGAGREIYDTAIRDGQNTLAEGITFLFGCAECGGCGSVFNVAGEYAAANSPDWAGQS